VVIAWYHITMKYDEGVSLKLQKLIIEYMNP
jgi:hypothetical protein